MAKGRDLEGEQTFIGLVFDLFVGAAMIVGALAVNILSWWTEAGLGSYLFALILFCLASLIGGFDLARAIKSLKEIKWQK